MAQHHRRHAAFLCICTALACLFTAGSVHPSCAADETDAAVIDPIEEKGFYSSALYDNTSGLPTAEANAIARTAEGAIWIGSYGGLIRYDGSSFERMDSTTGLASIVSLFVDSKNRLWVGTNDCGAAVIDRGETRMFNKADGLSSVSIRSVTETPDGSIYLATTHGLAVVNKDMQVEPVSDPRLDDEYIRTIFTGADGAVYGVTKSSCVFAVSGREVTYFYESSRLGLSDVHAVCPDPERPGYLYLGTTGSDLYYGTLSDKFKEAEHFDASPLGYINDIKCIDDMVWVCADDGIGYFRGDSFKLIDDVPMTTAIECMMPDFQGNLWFASSQQGVMKIAANRFLDLFERCGLRDEVVYSTCLFQNQLFVGTKNAGLMVLRSGHSLHEYPVVACCNASGEEWGTPDLIALMKYSSIRSIVRDSKDRVWFSTFGDTALLRFDHGIVTRFSTEDGLPSERVRTVHECADGSILVACTGGAALIEGDRVTQVYDESDGIENVEILTVTQADNGDYILGTDGGGIYVIPADGKAVRHFGTEDGLSSEVIMRIKKDKTRDLFWIVTSNSIAYITSSYYIETIRQFPYSNNFDLYENNSGKLWVLSSNGIYVTDVEELLRNEAIEPEYFGIDNGLPGITTSNSYSELTEDGDLYIATSKGAVKVNINDEFEDDITVHLDVPYIEADGTDYYADAYDRITIPSGTKKVTIRGYIYNYALINPTVRYYLSGFDDQKLTARQTELDAVSYTNLRGGTYYFVMELLDAQGGVKQTLTVEIEKEKAFYEVMWAHALFLLLIITLISVIVTLYLRHRTKVYQENAKRQSQLIREIVEAFAKVIDMKDTYTNGHSSRVAEYTAMLTRELGYDEDTVEKYYSIALLHDIGKVGVPAEVLNKPGKLTDEEFAIIKSHAARGYEVLKDISIMPELAVGAGAHHERPDGKGYPKGLKLEDIPRVAQIIAVADTFDAMYSNRPYRKRMNFEKAVSIVKEVSGTQLTSDVVEAFLRLVAQGKFRAPDDDGGGTTENIDNIHGRQKEEAAKSDSEKPAEA